MNNSIRPFWTIINERVNSVLASNTTVVQHLATKPGDIAIVTFVIIAIILLLLLAGYCIYSCYKEYSNSDTVVSILFC